MSGVGSRDDGPLERRAPGLTRIAPRLRLIAGSTPITEAPELAVAYGVGRLFVKRDDLSSPRYGGSKPRALEFLLGAARAAGARTAATLGPDGSHHVLATATHGVAAGFRVRAALFPQPVHADLARHRAALRALDVEVVRAPWAALMPAAAALARWRRDDGGGVPFWVPAGGASALGVLGAVDGALELAEDVAAGRAPEPDLIVVAAGSCGTAAGLLLGVGLAGLRTRVLAVRVTPRIVASRGKILRLARGAAALLVRAGDVRAAAALDSARLRVAHGQVGPGYGRSTPAADDALRRAAAAGIALETTYTAKALAALSGEETARGVVCFWNTFSAVQP